MAQKLLILDDTTSIISPWKKSIQEKYDVTEAVGGFEAQTKLRSTEFALIIVNISLPRFNGVEAVSRIRSAKKDVPIIVLYDKKDSMYLRQTTDMGIQGAVELPVNVITLYAKIQQLIPEDTEPSTDDQTNTQITPGSQKKHRSVRGSGRASTMKSDTGGVDLQQKFYEGQSAMATGQIDAAIEVYSSMLGLTSIKREGWRRYVEEAMFQLGRCYALKKDWENSTEHYGKFVSRAPKHERVKEALLNVGINYENQNDLTKAINFYKKVISLAPMDSLTTKARKRIKKIKGE